MWADMIGLTQWCPGQNLADVIFKFNFQTEWVSEWLNLMVFLGTADSDVHIVHISHNHSLYIGIII